MHKLFPGVIATTLVAFAQTLPAPAPTGDVIGVGNFLHVVSDVEKSLQFYQGVLGMDLQGPQPDAPRPYLDTPAIVNLYDAPGAQYRVGTTLVPASPMRAELVEWKGLDRSPVHPRYQDPGAATLILTVRNLDSIVARAKKAGTPIVTTGGEPVSLSDGRAILLRDPDGFFVELMQLDPAPAAPDAGNMIGVSFAFTVSDTGRMVEVFRDALGFQPQTGPFQSDKAHLTLMGTPGAQVRRTTALVPGTTFQVEFLEFTGIDRKPVHSRLRDPGSPLLRLLVRDLDSTLKALSAAGVSVASHEGKPVLLVNPNATLRIANTSAPDNLFVQLMQQMPKPPPSAQ
jgi:catechol 2,3-dioxygenase-like lactoylglutathione lyase family enzyme